MPLNHRGIEFVQKIGADLPIEDIIFDNMKRDYQGTMSNGDNSFIFPPATDEATVLGTQIGVLCVGCRPSSFHQRPSQPLVSLSCLAALAFSGAFIVSGTQSRPGIQMTSRWKMIHVGFNLRQNDLRRFAVHPGNGAQKINLPAKKGPRGWQPPR